MRQSLLTYLLLVSGVALPLHTAAQPTDGATSVGISAARTPVTEVPTGRFFTTTGVSLAFPVSTLSHVTKTGRGTTFNLEYRITSRFSVAAAWDATTFPVQTTKLVTDLEPALKLAINQLKGAYQTNAFGLYGIWYGRNCPVRLYLTGGIGLNSITVPKLVYDPQVQLLSLESATNLTGFLSGGIGINWQFSKPVAAFGEANAYIVPTSSPVASGSNNYLTAKVGLRFPLF